MKKTRQSVAFLLNLQHIAPAAEDAGKLPFAEKPVVMTAMHHPVTPPALAGMMLELRRKTGEQKITARLEQWQDAVEVASGVGAGHMVEAPVIDDHVERGRAERQCEKIRHLERHPGAGAGMLDGQRPGPADRERLGIDADHAKPPFGGVKRVAPLTAPEIEHQSGWQPLGEPAKRGRDPRLGAFHRPAVLAALIRLAKVPGLSRVHLHPPAVYSRDGDPVKFASEAARQTTTWRGDPGGDLSRGVSPRPSRTRSPVSGRRRFAWHWCPHRCVRPVKPIAHQSGCRRPTTSPG